jgi:hypothetical protein
MKIAALPVSCEVPTSGWHFTGSWSNAEREALTRTLRDRILNPDQARNHPWLFLAHNGQRYAHCPVVHEAGTAYVTATAEDLADVLWEHYFTLRLGPLAWTPPQAVPSVAAPGVEPPSTTLNAGARVFLSSEALEHFQTARVLFAEGDFAAAKTEAELSIAIEPPSSFMDCGRVELLGDVESALGNDTVAQRQYQRALDLVLHTSAHWTETTIRLKLAWCALRLDQVDAARALALEAVEHCVAAQASKTSNKRALNHLTALAYATLADVSFRRGDLEAARDVVQQAVTMSGRLGTLHAERVRLLTYMAWQLYLHGETRDARALATRAQQVLEQWMPIDAQHVRATRGTLAVILGSAATQTARRAVASSIPSREVLTELTVAAVRAMPDWLRQLLALHDLAPYLGRGAVTRPLNDIHLLASDRSHEDPAYAMIARADLVHTRAYPLDTPLRVARRLVRVDQDTLGYLGHLWLYAEALLRLRPLLDESHRAIVERSIVHCADTWRRVLNTANQPWQIHSAMRGLAVLLPSLSLDKRHVVITALEETLMAQLRTRTTSDETLLAVLPALAQWNAGTTVARTMLAREHISAEKLIAGLACTTSDEGTAAQEATVEMVLRQEQEMLPYSSTTTLGTILIHLAPYLTPAQAHRALALATPVRSIAVRVRALLAIAHVLPPDERAVVFHTAYQASQRTTEPNTRGEALTTLVQHLGD